MTKKTLTLSDFVKKHCYTDSEKTLARAVSRRIGWNSLIECPEDYASAANGVPGFTYYRDTHKFAKRYLTEIMDCLTEFESECGVDANNRYRKSDPVNWLAWFALEFVVNRVISAREELEA